MIDRNALIEADQPFVASLSAIGAAEGYLGSTAFIDGLLRVMVSDWMDALGSGTATPDLAKRLVDENAAILFGEVDGFGKLPGWNEPGGIDVYVAAELGTPDTGRDAIENALIQMLKQATAIANYADEPGVLDEQWRWQVDAMFEEYVNLFLGIPGEDPDGPEFGPPDEPLTEGWVTINTGDDDEGGQRVYIDGSGKMQTGKFAGQTMDQAFGKGGKAKADKPAEAPKSEPYDRPFKSHPDSDGFKREMYDRIKQALGVSDQSLQNGDVHPDQDPQDMLDNASGVVSDYLIPKEKSENKVIGKSGPHPANLALSKLETMMYDASDAPPAETPKAPAPDPKPADAPKPYKPPKPKPTPAGPAYAKKPEPKAEPAPAPDEAPKYVPPGEIQSAIKTYKDAGHSLSWDGDTAVIKSGNQTIARLTAVNPNQPKLDKPAAFSNLWGDHAGAKSLFNQTLNETPHYMDKDSVDMAFDGIPASEHDDLQKAIATVRPDLADHAANVNATGKAEREKWAKAKAENDDLMSVHPSLSKPGDLNKTKVKAAFKDVAPDQHDKLIKAIAAARPDLADHAAASKPKAKAATYKSKASVVPLEESPEYAANVKTMSMFKSMVKDGVDPATLIGAPDDGEVGYSRGPYEWDDEGEGDPPPSVVMQVTAPGVRMMTRELVREPSGKVVMINHELETDKAVPGLGRTILKNQVLAARKAGVSEIRTTAAGGPGEKMNGYYTWARYGYDAPLANLRKVIPSREKIATMQFQNTEIGKKAKAKMLAKHDVLDKLELEGSKSILDVMATQEGRDFWKANGWGFEGTFDLAEGSRSNKILNAYLAAKGEL